MKLAVVFPGIGYHVDKPLLYYSAKAAVECGWQERINVIYSTAERNIRGNQEKMQKVFMEIYEQAEMQLQEVDFPKYEEIVFISKSIGTVVAAAYARKHGICCKNVFYTPLEETFLFAPQNGIAFTGTADPWVHPGKIVDLCVSAGIWLQVIEGGNHSLETGHTLMDLANLQKVLEITEKYLNK